jgi:hypothetical protein
MRRDISNVCARAHARTHERTYIAQNRSYRVYFLFETLKLALNMVASVYNYQQNNNKISNIILL